MNRKLNPHQREAKKTRRKWVTSIAYEVEGVPQHLAFGSVLVRGKSPEGVDANMEWCERKVRENGVGLGDREFLLFSQLATTSKAV